jgi:hypothetical protein
LNHIYILAVQQQQQEEEKNITFNMIHCIFPISLVILFCARPTRKFSTHIFLSTNGKKKREMCVLCMWTTHYCYFSSHTLIMSRTHTDTERFPSFDIRVFFLSAIFSDWMLLPWVFHQRFMIFVSQRPMVIRLMTGRQVAGSACRSLVFRFRSGHQLYSLYSVRVWRWHRSKAV